MIPFIPPQWQFLAKFVVLLMAFFAGAGIAGHLTAAHYQAVIAQTKLVQDRIVQDQLLHNQQLAQQQAEQNRIAEEQHAKDQLAINRLGNELDRVRIHIPTCSGAMPTTSQAGADPDRAARLLSERVDAAFAKLQTGFGRLAQRCDQINIDAIAANSRNK